MSYVSKDGLRWAVQALFRWHEDQPIRWHANLVRVFVLKALGVDTNPAAAPIGIPDFRAVATRWFQVSYAEDRSQARTGNEPNYYSPFTGDLYKGPGTKSDFAAGTLWTRCDTLRKDGIVSYEDTRGPREFRFTQNYIPGLIAALSGGRGEVVRIPALPTALFFLRRPTDSGIDPVAINGADDFLGALRREFRLTDEELGALFDVSGELPPTALADEELSRNDVLDVIAEYVELGDLVRAAPQAVAVEGAEEEGARIAIIGERRFPPNWNRARADFAEAVDLVGVGEVSERLVAALRAGSNVVLIGPPGTGKTTLAEAAATRVKGESGYSTHTATADWSTFETIGGYMPSLAPDGSQRLGFRPGLVLEAIKRDNWLILDELNRADLDKAFGELFTFLSGKRVRLPFAWDGQDERIELVHGALPDDARPNLVGVPEDWRILATMNTFDKASLYQLSYALMRRFMFIDVPVPGVDQYVELIDSKVANRKDAEHGAFWDATLDLYRRCFATRERGLWQLKMPVGPGIPESMLAYTASRVTTGADGQEFDAKAVFLEAAAGFLFPQMEGQRGIHDRLVKSFMEDVLAENNADRRSELERQLAIWTGRIAD